MEHKYLEESLGKLWDKHKIDGLRDVILNRDDRLVLYAERTKQEAVLHIITGSFEIIGLEDKPSITMNELLSHFDFHSKYAEVAGKKEYHQSIYNEIHDCSKYANLSLPIITKKKRYWIRINIIPLKHHENISSVFITDVTKYLINEEEIFIKTHRDSLTGTFNKYTLDYHYGERYTKKNFHILYIDLDDFKHVNDNFGHEIGNEYLKKFGELLLSLENNYNRFYRNGGDEFVGLLFLEKEEVLRIANKILEGTKNISKSIPGISATASIGIIKAEQCDDVIRKADELLYYVKKNGKNHYRYQLESEFDQTYKK